MSQPTWPRASHSDANPLLLPGRQPRPTPAAEKPGSTRHREPPVSPSLPPIIAFSHLSWNWVWQRPQQFLSRFARQQRLLFVETYCSDVPATRIDLVPVAGHPNVTLAQMHLPSARWSDGAFIDAERRRALKATLGTSLRGRFERPLLWFYDPMAVVAFAGHLHERAIVYDCMDELSQFRGAPPELLLRERLLLEAADVVFCGGQKMRRRRLPVNPNTHFFGTGVDCDHFGAALDPSLTLAPEVAALGAAPVLGYFGVIDERIDYELLAALADARDDWHVVMIGPHAKVDPATFPRRPNLHWIGPRDYAQLPALTKGFSVALMPFALNAATEYINPTKALEYIAAGRPVVSTALDEVRLNFGRVARIASSRAEFIALCAAEVASPSRARIARGRKLAADNTWDAIAARMQALIEPVLAAEDATAAATDQTLPTSALPNLAYV
ncbi:glycosyltransferase [Opitutus sp. ER46]|uniref:glycosyltransferase n=1 Tax=Opitutus sp. ER46 TaxID=2161864 RepID=UPI000D30FCB1|nr:glycosyltransferase [Opitutus sp. ER46]PTY00330.1 glycosyltransferase family 1 protein [Opitutus sp. ER46]